MFDDIKQKTWLKRAATRCAHLVCGYFVYVCVGGDLCVRQFFFQICQFFKYTHNLQQL